MTFRAWFCRTDPQNIGGQFGTLSGFLRNTFWKQTSQTKPRNIFQTEKFQDYFWETRTSLFLGGSAFRLGYIYILSSLCLYADSARVYFWSVLSTKILKGCIDGSLSIFFRQWFWVDHSTSTILVCDNIIDVSSTFFDPGTLSLFERRMGKYLRYDVSSAWCL